MDKFRAINIVDVTDVLKHIIITNEIGGIPRLLVTIIENAPSVSGLYFAIFRECNNQYEVVTNRSSLDVRIILENKFECCDDPIEYWIKKFSPKLKPLSEFHERMNITLYLLSSQWDTFKTIESKQYLKGILDRYEVKCLNHDSYIMNTQSETKTRFAEYWKSILKSKAKIFFISDHSKTEFGKCFSGSDGAVVNYDFMFSYPRSHSRIDSLVVKLVQEASDYILVFSIIDGRKDPASLIQRLVSLNGKKRLVLIVRFSSVSREKIKQILDIAFEHKITIFYNPDDLTYLKLIQYASCIFYPSMYEGFGMVPIDCKFFGKTCYVPSGSDFSYLHDNVISFKSDNLEGIVNSCPPIVINNLSSFATSKFKSALF